MHSLGSVLLERVEGAYSDPNSISIEDLENVLRSFLRNCEDFEWSKSGEVSKKMFSKLQLEGLKFLSKFAEVQTNEDRDGDDKILLKLIQILKQRSQRKEASKSSLLIH